MPSSTASAQPRSNDQLNLIVLQRHEPEIRAILSIAPYAVLYTFSPGTSKWEKVGIEGTLFVCGLQASASIPNRFAVFILNRRGLENFFVELESSESVEITTEYVIVQTETQGVPEVYGIWIYQEPEPSSTADAREKNAKLIEHCARLAGLSREVGRDVLNERAGERVAGEGEDVTKEAEQQSVPTGQKEMAPPAVLRHVSESSLAAEPSIPQFQPSADTQFFLSGRNARVRG